MQFNDSGALGGSDALAWDNENGTLTVDHTLTTADDELVLEQTGDSFGTTRFRLRNRVGYNGFVVENTGLDLADLLFMVSSESTALFRFEHRDSSLVDGTNTEGEFLLSPNNFDSAMAIGCHVSTVFSHLKMNDARDLIVGESTGSKIATSATQKLGFFGAAPISQPQKSNYNNWSNLSDVVQALVDLGLLDQA